MVRCPNISILWIMSSDDILAIFLPELTGKDLHFMQSLLNPCPTE